MVLYNYIGFIYRGKVNVIVFVIKGLLIRRCYGDMFNIKVSIRVKYCNVFISFSGFFVYLNNLFII